MNELVVASIVVIAILGAAWLGALLRKVLPADHLTADSKDMVKVGIGFLATLAAMVLGLLVASAKNSYDTKVEEIQQVAVKLILLDHTLRDIGPEVDPMRQRLRSILADYVLPRWDRGAFDLTSPVQAATSPGAAAIHDLVLVLRGLTPATVPGRLARDRAIELTEGLAQTRFLLVEQAGRTIPVPFLVVLVLWLMAITASLTLLAPRNGTLLAINVICAVSFGSAIFLILEMDQPYTGLIRMSDAPLRTALALLSQ